MSRGFFIGRFQPFHNGHLAVIEDALTEVDDLIVGIGSSQYGYTKTNPFTLEERIEMIKRSVDSDNYKIVAIPDTNDYPKWIKNVERAVPYKFDTVYSGSPITIKLFKDAGYEVRVPKNKDALSATNIRNLLSKRNKEWKEYVPEGVKYVIEERFGEERMVYLSENYKHPKPSLSVDAIIKYDGGLVFVKRKIAPYKGMIALPGGHVDLGENIEKAVIREVEEETGLKFKVNGLLGVYSELGRDPRGYYATTVFYGQGSGKLRPGDDASEVYILKNVPKKMAFDHGKILEDYIKTVK
ncbi:MAG: nicotinamide-nucleotide adenylyltransferase [Candidatus Woesearchaeota archaeon]|nr:MAG: nicotinamide-nucleotide adenylyltransferase [Candidatus Woesearchaeota archaeon]